MIICTRRFDSGFPEYPMDVKAAGSRLSRWVSGLIIAAFAFEVQSETAFGPAIALGEGQARVYIITDDERPRELGVALDEAFLAALPQDGADGGIRMPDGHSTFVYVLAMPEDNPTPFQHVMLDWNPAGHEPPGIYDQPHFDVHFYTISDEERRTIHPGDSEFSAKGQRLPDATYIPAGYINPGLPPIPLMGLHLLDPDSPELRKENPAPFTRTFIYGTWDGKLIFAEPMVTRAFLEGKPDVTIPVPVAERYTPSGYYPASYSVRWDEAAGEYRIALTDLLQR